MEEPHEFVCYWVNLWTKVDPDVLQFELLTFNKIVEKHQFISIIVLIFPVLGIAFCCLDTLAQHEGRSLPIQSLSETYLSFCIVDLVFHLMTVYTCDCWARPATDLRID